MEKMKMVWFCDKYGLPLYRLNRHIKKFQLVDEPGYKKPWILDNDHNRQMAYQLLDLKHKPKLPRLTMEQFCQKYKVDESRLKARWTCIVKEQVDGITYIAETRNNLRHAGIIS